MIHVNDQPYGFPFTDLKSRKSGYPSILIQHTLKPKTRYFVHPVKVEGSTYDIKLAIKDATTARERVLRLLRRTWSEV